ncbi:MAG: response regulator transcription factor [Betaproteobacteria bacterium]
MNILLIEDESRIADFVAHGLEGAGYHVQHAADGELGLAMVRERAHSVVILDAMLPKLDGFELLRLMRQDGNTTPVIMLSAKVDLPYRLLGFETGADDYLPKPFFMEELVARVKALLARHSTQASSDTQVLQIDALSLNLITRKAHWHDVSAALSPREFSLLEYLMQSPGQIFSRKKILAHVWEIDFDPETNVVDVCIQRIKRKLGRKSESAPLPIESVRGVGYRIRAPGMQ